MGKNLKLQIIELLGSQYQDSDEPLIDELVYNFGMLKRAKTGLETDGLMMNTVRDPNRDPYYQKNPLFSIYDTCLKNINSLYTKLNVSPLDRRNWVGSNDIKDSFDEDFS